MLTFYTLKYSYQNANKHTGTGTQILQSVGKRKVFRLSIIYKWAFPVSSDNIHRVRKKRVYSIVCVTFKGIFITFGTNHPETPLY